MAANCTDDSNLIATYTYDGLGRRVSKTVSHCGSRNGAEYMYYNNKWQLLEIRTATYDGEGTLTGDKPRQQFVWGSQYIDEAVCMDVDTDSDGVCNDLGDTPAGSRRFFYCQDANYNVIALREADTIVERYEYDPYGTCRVLTGWNDDSAGETLNVTSQSLKWLDSSLPENPIRFCGYFLDGETGIYNVRHRVYIPALHRWCQRDPIAYKGGYSNLYCYCGDEPLNHFDPTGKVALGGCLVGGAVSGGTTALIAFLNGESWECIGKKAACAGLGGCIQGAVLAQFPSTVGGCIGAALGNLATAACEAGLGAGGPLGPCDAISFAVNTFLGCAGGYGADAGENIQWILGFLGFDQATIGNLCPGLAELFR